MQIYRLEEWQGKKGVETAGSILKKNIKVRGKYFQSKVNGESRVTSPHWLNHKLLNLLKFKNFEKWPITKHENSIHCLLKLK